MHAHNVTYMKYIIFLPVYPSFMGTNKAVRNIYLLFSLLAEFPRDLNMLKNQDCCIYTTMYKIANY